MYMIPVVCAILGAFLIVVYHNAGKKHREQITCTGINVVVTDSLENRVSNTSDCLKKDTDAGDLIVSTSLRRWTPASGLKKQKRGSNSITGRNDDEHEQALLHGLRQ